MQTGGTHPNPGGVPPVSRKSSMSSQIVTSSPRNERLLHPLPLRIMHWLWESALGESGAVHVSKAQRYNNVDGQQSPQHV
jgi:hypothetical protein